MHRSVVSAQLGVDHLLGLGTNGGRRIPKKFGICPLPACQIQSTFFIPANKLADITTSADLASPETRNTQNWGGNLHWPHDSIRPRGSESCGEATGLPKQSERSRAGFRDGVPSPILEKLTSGGG